MEKGFALLLAVRSVAKGGAQRDERLRKGCVLLLAVRSAAKGGAQRAERLRKGCVLLWWTGVRLKGKEG